MEIEKIDGEIGEVTLRGQILTCESRELRSGKFILTFDVTDFTDTITAKMFIRPEIFNEVKDMIKTGMFIKIKGVTTIDKFDGELTLGSIVGIKKADDFTTKRMDNSLEKRVARGRGAAEGQGSRRSEGKERLPASAAEP